MSKDNQDKIIEQKFWDLQSTKSKYLTFDQKVYSAFRINEYALMIERANYHYPINPGSKILDIGCGAGVSTIVLSKLGYSALGIDISPGLIDQAKRLAASENSNSEFIVGDASSTDFSDRTFDVCFMVGLLHHFPNYNPVLHEIQRILKDSGILIAVEPNLLNWSYMKSFKLVQQKNGVSPNEYPLSPNKVSIDMKKYFVDIKIYPFREWDVPFLRQISFGWFELPFKYIILFYRKSIPWAKGKGTFFIICCHKLKKSSHKQRIIM